MGVEVGRSRELNWYDTLTININWFAITTRSQVLTPLVIPLLVQRFVGEGLKGTYVGQVRLWALMAALLIQALMGMLSDRSPSRWGRRRPFIFWGALGEIIVFALIGLAAGLEGSIGYWVFFGLVILSMAGSNASQAATQALIPDLVPDRLKGRYSGVKAALELPLPLIFVSLIVAPLMAAGNFWAGLLALMAVLLTCMALTMLVPEGPLEGEPGPMDWNPVIRLVLMTAAFTLVILGLGGLVNQTLAVVEVPESPMEWLAVGAAGSLGMSAAVVAGVWMSTRISLGEAAQDHRSFRWWVVNRLAFLVGANNLASFMVFFLQERFPTYQGERAAGPAAQILMFVGIFILATAIPGGWLSDRWGKKPLLLAAGMLAAAGTGIAVTAPSLQVIILGGCLIGAGVGLFYAASWALGTSIVPQEKAGQYLGISNLAGAGAGAVGAYIGGPIADGSSFVLLMSIYGVIMLASVLPLLGVKES